MRRDIHGRDALKRERPPVATGADLKAKRNNVLIASKPQFGQRQPNAAAIEAARRLYSPNGGAQ
jgi:hypothetical protein